MSRILITGSTDGLGLAAARQLITNGHEAVLHARSSEREKAVGQLAAKALGVVVGDLSEGAETRSIADQVNTIGRMDAVIHNAGIYSEPARGDTPEGHPKILAVNTLAPYILTALIERPIRLIYLSSGMHQSGGREIEDIDWRHRPWNTGRAYSESKLHVAALSAAVARYWPEVSSNAVDPGWVPIKMGGAGAPDDLAEGYQTQVWLATSDDEKAKSSGGYWYHRERRKPSDAVTDPVYQDELVRRLETLTDIKLF